MSRGAQGSAGVNLGIPCYGMRCIMALLVGIPEIFGKSTC